MNGPQTQASQSFRWFDSSPEVIQLFVMLYVRYPLSFRNVEDLTFERGVDICHETVRKWGEPLSADVRLHDQDRQGPNMREHTYWRWHLDEVYVQINGRALPLGSG